jgi:hypothetical protein
VGDSCALLSRSRVGKQPTDSLDELLRRRSARQPRPLHPLEGIRDSGILCARLIEAHRHQERTAAGDPVTSLVGQIPLQAEVALVACLRVRRDDGHEQRAVLDLAPDLPIPLISAAQRGAVEPDLDSGGPQRIGNAFSGRRILGGIAQKHCAQGLCHLFPVFF